MAVAFGYYTLGAQFKSKCSRWYLAVGADLRAARPEVGPYRPGYEIFEPALDWNACARSRGPQNMDQQVGADYP